MAFVWKVASEWKVANCLEKPQPSEEKFSSHLLVQKVFTDVKRNHFTHVRVRVRDVSDVRKLF